MQLLHPSRFLRELPQQYLDYQASFRWKYCILVPLKNEKEDIVEVFNVILEIKLLSSVKATRTLYAYIYACVIVTV